MKTVDGRSIPTIMDLIAIRNAKASRAKQSLPKKHTAPKRKAAPKRR